MTSLAVPVKPSLGSNLLLPVVSSRPHGWENLVVEQYHLQNPGQVKLHNPVEHVIYLGQVPRPISVTRIRGERVQQGLWVKGDTAITPASGSLPELWRWDGEDKYVEMRLAKTFVDRVALEALDLDPSRVELNDQFKARDLQLERIGLMLLTELQGNALGGQIFIESLANVLAVHLLRNYTTNQTTLNLPTDGLPGHYLRQVTEYIYHSLDQEIKLAELAALLDMSQFHFGRCFKQALGMSPHQYIIQQRVERAKQLLQNKELSLIDISLQCGFSSQSHLGEWFRKIVGVTPKAYRKGL